MSCTMGFGGPTIGWLGLGSAAGGGAGVDSFNTRMGDVVPVSGDYTATQVTSTGPSTVQADLDALANLSPITSVAELETRWPAAGGVHTITEGGAFQLLTGETQFNLGVNQIELVPPAKLEGVGGKVTFVSAIDGPVVFGEGSLSNVAIVPVGGGPLAKCIALTSAGSKLVIDECDFVGQDPGTITPSGAVVTLVAIALPATGDGAKALRFDGSFTGLFIDQVIATVAGPTPRTVLEVLSTASFGSSMAVDRSILLSSNVGDALIDIDPAATLPATALFTTTQCQIDGPGNLFAAGSLDESDPKVLSSGQRNARNSLWLGDVFFDSPLTPIVLTHTGAPTWDVVPFENALAADVLTENALDQRFELVRRALQDWGVEGRGRTNEKFGSVSWSAAVTRNGGGAVRPFSARVETRPDNISPWVAVPETTALTEMAGASPTTVGTGAPFRWGATAEFRLVAQGDAGTSTSIFAYRLTPNAQ